MTGQITLPDDLPRLQNTRLGWIVSGKLTKAAGVSAICAIFGEDDATTTELIKRFWEIDDFDTDKTLTINEQRCETHFVQNTTRH